jgi:hypothetical protein
MNFQILGLKAEVLQEVMTRNDEGRRCNLWCGQQDGMRETDLREAK